MSTTAKQMFRMSAIALPAIILMGCGYGSVSDMNKTSMSGDGFNPQMAREYRDISNYEVKEREDWTSGVWYANRSIASAEGNPPLPTNLRDHNISDAQQRAELEAARERLMQAIADGARQKTPTTAVAAQANFDCWAEQMGKVCRTENIAACKDGFWRAIQATETAMAPAPAPAPVAQAPEPAPAVTASTFDRVYFGWDESDLTAGARATLDEAIRVSRASGQSIQLVGHTDSSGTADYNMALSERRTDAVRTYLVERGVPHDSITYRSVGQTDAVAATGDNVRNAAERNVSIELLTRTASSN